MERKDIDMTKVYKTIVSKCACLDCGEKEVLNLFEGEGAYEMNTMCYVSCGCGTYVDIYQ